MLPGEIDGARFLRAMAKLGWRVTRERGSHRVLKKAGGDRIIVIAFHRSLSRNSARRALRDAGVDEDEFERIL
jgi:predicted RNA binding protein YcfA (HicA-like mRNA interferase family)